MDSDNDNAPIRREEEDNRQVSVWTPEDAARFLSSAIQQSQRPLTDALNKRSVSPGIFALVIVLLVAAAAGCGWVLLDRLDKSEAAADAARGLREQALVQQHELKSKHDVVAARLLSSQEQLDRVRRELETENERLRTEATGLKVNEEELKRMRNDIQRYRRQNELLRSQISGLEMEKQALSRQLTVVKALASGDDDLFSDLDDLADPAAKAGEESPPPPEAAVSSEPPAIAVEEAAGEPVRPAEPVEQVEPQENEPAEAEMENGAGQTGE